jgi:hypothetical protein
VAQGLVTLFHVAQVAVVEVQILLAPTLQRSLAVVVVQDWHCLQVGKL